MRLQSIPLMGGPTPGALLGSRFSLGACHTMQTLRANKSFKQLFRPVGSWSTVSDLPHFACSVRASYGEANAGGSFRPPQETVLEAISEVAKAEGRVAQTTNVVMGGTVSGQRDDEWRALDEKVNSYPTTRGFTAIGTGGDDFVQAMVGAVESVLQCPIPEGGVTLNMSSGGKYVSVRIGPVEVDSSEQVQAVYDAMRRDVRMKYFL